MQVKPTVRECVRGEQLTGYMPLLSCECVACGCPLRMPALRSGWIRGEVSGGAARVTVDETLQAPPSSHSPTAEITKRPLALA